MSGASVPPVFSSLFSDLVFKPVLRPLLRVVSGVVAIPVFRFLLKRVLRVQTSDAELERDLEMWFRGAILLLAATANLEDVLFGWLPWHRVGDENQVWQTLLLRLLLAVGVIESMPDQDLFGLLHRGPPRLRLTSRQGWREAWAKRWAVVRGALFLHLRRSSPVLAIMTVVWGGQAGSTANTVGWWCYGAAVAQYLVIALVTQRDRVQGLLDAFEREAVQLRQEIMVAAGTAGVAPDDEDPEGPPSLRVISGQERAGADRE